VINGFHKSDMFKKYAISLAENKPLSITSLRDLEANTKALGISRGAVAKAIKQVRRKADTCVYLCVSSRRLVF
jgi:hypothetical protein